MKMFEEAKLDVVELNDDIITVSAVDAGAYEEEEVCTDAEDGLDLCITVPEMDD